MPLCEAVKLLCDRIKECTPDDIRRGSKWRKEENAVERMKTDDEGRKGKRDERGENPRWEGVFVIIVPSAGGV